MAEFQEVMKQWHRMCNDYERCIECSLCVAGYMGIDKLSSVCYKFAFESPLVFEHTVMSWAAEHPEPVYPTWFEWLIENDFVVPVAINDVPTYVTFGGEVRTMNDTALFTLKAMQPIPAEIAEKLGIEPKEG